MLTGEINQVASSSFGFLQRALRKALSIGSILESYTHTKPDFIIFGAQRCGTTSLYHYLEAHPCVLPAMVKEVHFFDYNFSQGYHWYRQHFPSLISKYDERYRFGRHCITGEATPYYIFHPLACQRIAALLPNVKLITLLRNPVDRAYSHYQYQCQRGREPLSFESAIDAEPHRISGEADRILQEPHYRSFNHERYSYLARGLYVHQLKKWLACFPRKQMLIVKSEDFYSDPRSTFASVLGFLGLPAWEPGQYHKYNESDYDPMSAGIRKRLTEYFRPHNANLYELLGEDFGWDEDLRPNRAALGER